MEFYSLGDVKPLTGDQIILCQNTMSSNTFYMLVLDALETKTRLSVVRMADGEWRFMSKCSRLHPALPVDAVVGFNPTWLQRYGCQGISCGQITTRLRAAATECTYFAPSITGIHDPEWNLHTWFPYRNRYVDNFFINAWNEKMKIDLFTKAQHVLFIHRSTSTADAMQIRAKVGLGVRVTYLKMEKWQDSEDVIRRADDIDAPLVLFSAGPASKYIGPRIANGKFPRVTLDIGNAADYWTLNSLKHIKRVEADAVAL